MKDSYVFYRSFYNALQKVKDKELRADLYDAICELGLNENFPSETNEKYAVLRVYPAGTPNGTANPRIIGMIKHTVFYVFFLDWDGKFYNHGR